MSEIQFQQNIEAKRKYARERARKLRENPEYRALELERNKRWQEANPEQYAEAKRVSGRAWYQVNREEKLESNKQWKRANPDKVNAMGRVHNAKRRARVAGFNEEIRAYISIIQNDPCAYCDAPFEHVDHITPLSQEGDHDWTNLTAACADCNRCKQAKPLLGFLLCV